MEDVVNVERGSRAKITSFSRLLPTEDGPIWRLLADAEESEGKRKGMRNAVVTNEA